MVNWFNDQTLHQYMTIDYLSLTIQSLYCYTHHDYVLVIVRLEDYIEISLSLLGRRLIFI